MTTPLLDFSTLEPERPKIRIDGQLYELCLLSDFGLIAQSRLARLIQEGVDLEKIVADQPPPESTGNHDADRALAALGAVPEGAAERARKLLDETVELILMAPPEVRARLSEMQKRRIVEAFTPAVMAATPTETKGRRTRPSRSTSGSSSRSSRRRTAPAPG